jgi:hypothetical protein
VPCSCDMLVSAPLIICGTVATCRHLADVPAYIRLSTWNTCFSALVAAAHDGCKRCIHSATWSPLAENCWNATKMCSADEVRNRRVHALKSGRFVDFHREHMVCGAMTMPSSSCNLVALLSRLLVKLQRNRNPCLYIFSVRPFSLQVLCHI